MGGKYERRPCNLNGEVLIMRVTAEKAKRDDSQIVAIFLFFSVLLRSVAVEDKSFAIGIQFLIMRTLGNKFEANKDAATRSFV